MDITILKIDKRKLVEVYFTYVLDERTFESVMYFENPDITEEDIKAAIEEKLQNI